MDHVAIVGGGELGGLLAHVLARRNLASDIRLIDVYYTAEEKDALVALCDCYVSLHRSEGLGLTMAEAMAAGKPVIATGYSGNMQFMTAANSFLVEYVLTPVAANCEPYPEGAVWADPAVRQVACVTARPARQVRADMMAAMRLMLTGQVLRPGYGWLLRSVFGVLALGALAAGQVLPAVPVRDVCAVT